MKEFRMVRVVPAFMVAMAALGATLTAQAQTSNSIFPAGIESRVRDRLFMRLGYTTAFIKTKSEEARDITGPVVTRQELLNAFDAGITLSSNCGADTDGPCALSDFESGNNYDIFKSQLQFAMEQQGLVGFGTPPGIKVKAQKSAGTPTISVGYWLDDNYKWLVEAYVLAAPLSVKLYGDGIRADGTPNTLNGRHIATSKLLPPLVIGSYNFGKRGDTVRPFIGAGAMYAIFFDARSTPFFDDYQGGKTTITTKNVFGFGPFAGVQTAINDDWHLNLTVGQVSLKTTSRLVTSGTQIKTGSAVLNDIGVTNDVLTDVPYLIDGAEGAWTGITPLTTSLMSLVKINRNNAADLGTYVREQKMKITNTIVTLSVGYRF